MATTPLLRWRAEIDDRRDEVQKSEIQLPSPMSDTSDMVINDQQCSAFRLHHPSALEPVNYKSHNHRY
jgi:hypothetical protein